MENVKTVLTPIERYAVSLAGVVGFDSIDTHCEFAYVRDVANDKCYPVGDWGYETNDDTIDELIMSALESVGLIKDNEFFGVKSRPAEDNLKYHYRQGVGILFSQLDSELAYVDDSFLGEKEVVKLDFLPMPLELYRVITCDGIMVGWYRKGFFSSTPYGGCNAR